MITIDVMIIIYSTYPSLDEARAVSKALLEKRLVACANISPAHEAMYWWKDQIESAEEIAVIYKTQPELFETVKDRIIALHSYDVPCVVSWPTEQGHDAFLNWITAETEQSRK